MDPKAILNKIDSDATEAVAQILQEAQSKTKILQEASQARIDKQKQDALSRVEKDGVLMRERMLRMADLEDKKDLLAKKRNIMDDSFKQALFLLEQEKPEQLSALFLSLIAQNANGDEALLIGDKNSSWYTEAFLQNANAALQKMGKQGGLKKGATAVEGVGFALEKEGMLVNCTLTALLNQNRMNLETEVAQILFG